MQGTTGHQRKLSAGSSNLIIINCCSGGGWSFKDANKEVNDLLANPASADLKGMKKKNCSQRKITYRRYGTKSGGEQNQIKMFLPCKQQIHSQRQNVYE